MRAALYHAARDVRVEDVAEPAAVGAHQVLVEPILCGICGTDLHEFTDGPIVTPVEPHPLNGSQLPQILGHEFSARVVEVGGEVESVRRGDRVSVMPLLVCGRCPYCIRGLNHLCQKMACTGLSSDWGGIAELALLEEYQVAALPDSVSDVQGALIEPAAVAAYGVDRSGATPGDVALITGGGPIGALAALYAAAMGAVVIVSEPNRNRADFVRSLGVGDVLDPTGENFQAEIEERTEGLGVNVAIECSGNAAALNSCIVATRSRGTVVQTGLHTGPASILPMDVSLKDLSIVGTWCYPIYDWPRIIRLLGTGKFPIEKVVTDRIDAAAVVAKGFEALLDPQGDQVKVLVGIEAQ